MQTPLSDIILAYQIVKSLKKISNNIPLWLITSESGHGNQELPTFTKILIK